MKNCFNIAIYNQETYTDYPESASNNAKRALTIRDEPDSKTSKCGTPVGWARANQLAKKEPISRDTIARMASFNRHKQNSEGDPRENCGPLMWLAWGGTSGINWAINKMEQLRKANNAVKANLFGDINDVWSLAQTEELIAMTEGEDMELLINSPGGDVFTGMAIASLLARRKGNTTTTAIGLAASIASIILLAGDKVQMDERAFLMIHDAWAFSAGDASELRKDARLLEKISNQLAELYTGKIKASGKLINGNEEETREKVRRMMKAETWLTAQEALDMGLIDEIVNGGEYTEQPDINLPGQQQTDEKELKAGVYNRLKNYKNTPNQILNKYQMQEDKKTLWQAIKAFFGAEIKAEAEAMQQPQPEPAEKEPEVKPEPTQKKEMTREEMIAALAAEGYEVEKKPEPVAEKDPVAEMQAQIKALQDELKASKIKAAAQPAGGTEPKAKKGNKTVWTEERLTVFNGLAELAKTHRR